jgi:hypothetical protein
MGNTKWFCLRTLIGLDASGSSLQQQSTGPPAQAVAFAPRSKLIAPPTAISSTRMIPVACCGIRMLISTPANTVKAACRAMKPIARAACAEPNTTKGKDCDHRKADQRTPGLLSRKRTCEYLN